MVKKKPDPKKDRQRDMFQRSVKAKDKDLKGISELVSQHEALTAEYNALLMTAEEIWKQILDLERQKLPAAMAEAGTSDFTDASSGAQVEMDSYLSGTWPTPEEKPEQNRKALAWLKKINQEGLLKCEVILKFGKKEAAEARKIAAQVKKGGKATVQVKERIHPQTLLAFFRERLKEGKSVPFDIFDGETGTYAKVTMPKQEGGK